MTLASETGRLFYIRSSSTVTFSGITFQSGSANDVYWDWSYSKGNGGCLYVASSTVVVSDATFKACTATGYTSWWTNYYGSGGAIYLDDSSTAELTSVFFNANTATFSNTDVREGSSLTCTASCTEAGYEMTGSCSSTSSASGPSSCESYCLSASSDCSVCKLSTKFPTPGLIRTVPVTFSRFRSRR